jgi:hypothetical protein
VHCNFISNLGCFLPSQPLFRPEDGRQSLLKYWTGKKKATPSAQNGGGAGLEWKQGWVTALTKKKGYDKQSSDQDLMPGLSQFAPVILISISAFPLA